MKNLVVRDDFKKLIPRLQEDTFSLLEKDILDKGILSPILIWDNIIIDGHNRYDIAVKHNIDFETKVIEFKDEIQAKQWILQNQSSRCNVNVFSKAELAIKYLSLVKEKEGEVKGDIKRNIVEKVFGLSLETVYRVKYILKYGSLKQIQSARNEEKSILDIWTKVNLTKRLADKPISRFFKSLDNTGEFCNTDCWSYMKDIYPVNKVNLVITEPVQPEDDEMYKRFGDNDRLKLGYSLSLFEKLLSYLQDFVAKNCDFFFIVDPDYIGGYLEKIKMNYTVRQIIVWDYKNTRYITPPIKLQKRTKFIIWCYKGEPKPLTKIISDIIVERMDSENQLDSIPKNLAKTLISIVEKENTHVFDPFAGRASVIRASLDMKVMSCGCEYNADIYKEGLALLEKERGSSVNKA